MLDLAVVRGGRFLAELARGAGLLLAEAARDLLRPRRKLLAENVALRAQLAALKRQVRRAAPSPSDRALLVAVDRLFPRATGSTLHLVRPETLLRWHRDLSRWLWAWRSRNPPRRRPPRRTSEEVRGLILRMAKENDWGTRRIVGELKKLGIRCSRRTVQRILKAEFPAGGPTPSQPWATFVRNHLQGTWACDFFTVTTLGFRQLYVLFFLRLDTREVVHVEVTEHPTGAWTTQQLRNACWDEEPPQRLIRDRDGKFVASFDRVLGTSGRVLRTPPRTPVANAFAERMVRTFRRELFHHVVPRDVDHARELLRTYLAHYHPQRPHQGLDQRTPAQVRTGEPDPADASRATPCDDVDLSQLVVTPVLNGLFHEYTLAA